MKKVSISFIILTILMALLGCQKKSSEKEILSFKFISPNIEASIEDRMIIATVPFGTDVTNLVPIISASDKATVNPASGMSQDFSQPVTYTVIAEDGSQNSYTAIVTVDMPEKPFFGIWGVEKIEYYNIDYAGNPIAASLTTYLYDPNDTDNGIQLVFRENKSGEIRNGSIDTIWMNENYIVCPDTVIVAGYTYSFDFETSVLSMNMEYGRTFALQIVEQNADAFVYENEYVHDYVEKAYLRRISDVPDKSKPTRFINQAKLYKYKEGSLLGR